MNDLYKRLFLSRVLIIIVQICMLVIQIKSDIQLLVYLNLILAVAGFLIY